MMNQHFNSLGLAAAALWPHTADRHTPAAAGANAARCDLRNANSLLAAMPQAQWERWLPHLEWVEMALGQVLCEARATPSHLYFPTTAVVSVMYLMSDGASTEVAVVGNEGVVGSALFMGGQSTPSTPSRAVVQSAGRGLALRAGVLMDDIKPAGPALQLLLRHSQALITQIAQNAVCNRHHTLDQQLCRWLLMRLDRLADSEMATTHERIATMLGVRREGITETALKLQHAGLIRCTRGHIAVLDPRGLERRSCECYGVVCNAYQRLLPGSLPARKSRASERQGERQGERESSRHLGDFVGRANAGLAAA